MTTLPAGDMKRARPQLNVYTVLLLVAVLLGIFGVTVIALMNMDASGKGPFDAMTAR